MSREGGALLLPSLFPSSFIKLDLIPLRSVQLDPMAKGGHGEGNGDLKDTMAPGDAGSIIWVFTQ